ncbi:MAG: hypothetical protein WBQ14_00545 [Gaiellaceae bacterium]
MRVIHSIEESFRVHRTLRFALPLIAVAGLTAVLLPAVGSAQAQAAPANTAVPTIVGTPVGGNTLTASNGTWSGSPTTFAYLWLRCPADGGAADGSNCGVIPSATTSAYVLGTADVGFRIRVRVTASNADGSVSAVSNATSAVTAAVAPTPPATGCPSGTGPMQIAQVSPPARLLIDHQQVTPSPVTRSTTSIVARFHVTACGGRSVQGALIYATTVPFSQFSIPSEQPTGADGWITLKMQRLSKFPASPHQRLLVMFGRARKAGESELGGISTRRLVASRVDLSH